MPGQVFYTACKNFYKEYLVAGSQGDQTRFRVLFRSRSRASEGPRIVNEMIDGGVVQKIQSQAYFIPFERCKRTSGDIPSPIVREIRMEARMGTAL